MSRAPKGARADKDHYVTPQRLIVPLVRELREQGWLRRPLRVLDPGAGTGIIARTIRDEFADERGQQPYIVAVEIDRTYEENLHAMSGANEVVMLDYMRYGDPSASAFAAAAVRLTNAKPGDTFGPLPMSVEPFDMIIANPPFSLFTRFIEQSRRLVAPDGVIAMLLNMHAYGSGERLPFWQRNAPDAQRVLSPRPSFTGGSTDSTEYAWVIWGQRPAAAPAFAWYDIADEAQLRRRGARAMTGAK